MAQYVQGCKDLGQDMSNLSVACREKKWECTFETLLVSRPFQLLSIDIVGPLPITQKGNRYLLVNGRTYE